MIRTNNKTPSYLTGTAWHATSVEIIDREFVTSAKKFANFNKFSEFKKFIKIR